MIMAQFFLLQHWDNKHTNAYCILILCPLTSIAHLAITYIFSTKHVGHGQREHAQNAEILSSVSGHNPTSIHMYTAFSSYASRPQLLTLQ
jgi:hypothetical protein